MVNNGESPALRSSLRSNLHENENTPCWQSVPGHRSGLGGFRERH
jgi:hypothetical protein